MIEQESILNLQRSERIRVLENRVHALELHVGKLITPQVGSAPTEPCNPFYAKADPCDQSPGNPACPHCGGLRQENNKLRHRLSRVLEVLHDQYTTIRNSLNQ